MKQDANGTQQEWHVRRDHNHGDISIWQSLSQIWSCCEGSQLYHWTAALVWWFLRRHSLILAVDTTHVSQMSPEPNPLRELLGAKFRVIDVGVKDGNQACVLAGAHGVPVKSLWNLDMNNEPTTSCRICPLVGYLGSSDIQLLQKFSGTTLARAYL